MRKRLSLFMVCLLLCGQLMAQRKPWDGLKGKVKVYTQNFHQLLNDDGTPATNDYRNKFVSYYDPNGKIIRTEVWVKDSLEHIHEYNYNANGYTTVSKNRKKVKGVTTWFTGLTMNIQYDHNDQVVNKAGDGSPSSVDHYDKNGRLDSTIHYNIVHKFSSKYVYNYDEYDRKKELTVYDKDGVEQVSKFQYDPKGREIQQDQYDGHTKLTGTIEHEYDEHGNEINYTTSFLSGFGPQHMVTIHRISRYTYDKAGNWLTREEMTGNGKVKSITENVIEYY